MSLADVLTESLRAGGRDRARCRSWSAAEAARVGFDERFLSRPLNVDLSGGERKRNETVQLGVLRPRFAVLDEIDSGLDVDALRAVARRVEAATTETGLGVLAITHYTRLLGVLRPDHTHVLSRGRIVGRGGPELADELERTGYAGWVESRGGRRDRRPASRPRPEIETRFGVRPGGPPLRADGPASRGAQRTDRGHERSARCGGWPGRAGDCAVANAGRAGAGSASLRPRPRQSGPGPGDPGGARWPSAPTSRDASGSSFLGLVSMMPAVAGLPV